MISSQGLAGLRIAATLVHGVPGLQMTVRGSGGDVAASVGWPNGSGHAGSGHAGSGHAGTESDPDRPETGRDTLVLTPCAFRKAVAQAHALHEQGRRMAFLDLGPGCDPRVEMILPARGAMFGGGIFRVPLDGRWLFAFGTTLDAATCRSVAADLVDEALPLGMLAALGVRSDDDTDVSIVYAETAVRVAPHPSRPVTRPVAGTDEEARLIDLLQAMLARFATHELLHDLEGTGVRHG